MAEQDVWGTYNRVRAANEAASLAPLQQAHVGIGILDSLDKLNRERQFRGVLSQLGPNPTPEQISAVATQFAKPETLLNTFQESEKTKAQLAVAKELATQRLSQAASQFDTSMALKLRNALTAEDQAQIKKEWMQGRLALETSAMNQHGIKLYDETGIKTPWLDVPKLGQKSPNVPPPSALPQNAPPNGILSLVGNQPAPSVPVPPISALPNAQMGSVLAQNNMPSAITGNGSSIPVNPPAEPAALPPGLNAGFERANAPNVPPANVALPPAVPLTTNPAPSGTPQVPLTPTPLTTNPLPINPPPNIQAMIDAEQAPARKRKILQEWQQSQIRSQMKADVNLAGGRESVQNNRILTAANEAVASLKNMVELPLESSMGIFGTRGSQKGLMNAGMETLAQKMSVQSTQDFRSVAQGIGRFLGTLETQGMQVPATLVQDIEKLKNLEGMTNLTKMRNFAEIRQIIERAVEPALANPRIPEEQKIILRKVVSEAQTAVPWTQSDITKLQKLGMVNSKATMEDVIGKSKELSGKPPLDSFFK